MTLATLFTLNLLSVSIGTFVANFGLMWLIGTRARKAEQKYAQLMRELQTQAIRQHQADVKKRQEYLRMES